MSKKEMTLLMARLMEIDTECQPERAKKAQKEAEANLDDFTIEKRKLASFTRDIKAEIAERDKFLAAGDRSGAAKKSAEIRKAIKQAKTQGKDLQAIHDSKHSKLKAKMKLPGVTIKDETKVKDENRKKIVDLMWKNLDEKNPSGGRAKDDSYSNSSGSNEIVGGGIADFDDPKFELLRRQDQEIDEKLDVVYQGVLRLKDLARQVGEEVDQQTEMIENINEIAEKTLDKLETVNGQLKETLDEVRSGRDLCCDLIILCVILGIATAIYFMLT